MMRSVMRYVLYVCVGVYCVGLGWVGLRCVGLLNVDEWMDGLGLSAYQDMGMGTA